MTPYPQDELTKKLAAHIKDRMEQLRQLRTAHEACWRRIAEWMLPRRSFTLERTAGALVRRRIVDMTAPRSGGRLAALLHGYLIDTHEPFIAPMLPRQRRSNIREQRWLESVEEDMFTFMTGGRSKFRSALMESLLDDVFFGNSVMWTGKSQRTGRPAYKSLRLMECYWDEDDDGEVDTLYREFKLTLKNALAKYPTPELVEKSKKDRPDWSEEFTFVHAVEPRANGVKNGPTVRKPWTSNVLNATTNEIAFVGGFDSFRFSVTRYQKQSGDVYGTGPGWESLPAHVLLNNMTEDILIASEDMARPALVDWSGRLKKLDRRPGAFNSMNAAELMLMEPGQIVTRLHEAGDPRSAIQMAQDARIEIEYNFYVDWIRRQEGQPPSATQVNDDIDIRLKSLSGVVARIEPEKMTPTADSTFEIMQAADMFELAPETLDGIDLDFGYNSPLSIAQRKERLRHIAAGLEYTKAVAEIDPEAIDVLDTDKLLRDAYQAAGLRHKFVRSEDELAARRKKRRDAEEEARQLDNAAAAAGAARDAGQAIASVQGQGLAN